MFNCPKCRSELQIVTTNPKIMCGAIYYLHCVQCKKYFRENQSGICARPTNLKEIPVSSTEELEKYISKDLGIF